MAELAPPTGGHALCPENLVIRVGLERLLLGLVILLRHHFGREHLLQLARRAEGHDELEIGRCIAHTLIVRRYDTTSIAFLELFHEKSEEALASSSSRTLGYLALEARYQPGTHSSCPDVSSLSSQSQSHGARPVFGLEFPVVDMILSGPPCGKEVDPELPTPG